MSDEEQHIVIGRLIAELGAANQELALARESLRRYGSLFGQLSAPETAPNGLALVKELIANEAHAERRQFRAAAAGRKREQQQGAPFCDASECGTRALLTFWMHNQGGGGALAPPHSTPAIGFGPNALGIRM